MSKNFVRGYYVKIRSDFARLFVGDDPWDTDCWIPSTAYLPVVATPKDEGFKGVTVEWRGRHYTIKSDYCVPVTPLEALAAQADEEDELPDQGYIDS